MSEKSSTASGGISLTGVLFIVFLVLKLTGVIQWSWWWVTAPLWGGVALVIAILLVVGMGALIASAWDNRARKRRIARRG